MIQTPARARFKQHLGQANHFLVTSLVALEELDRSPVTEAPPELRAAWNPKDKGASVARTRNFVLQSFLGWAVDSIDMYVSLLNRKPKLVQDEKLISNMDGAGRSVSRKVRAIAGHFEVTPGTQALIDVLITWRNNVFHELADNELQLQTTQALVEHSAALAERYRGLLVEGLASKAEKGAALTFKESASLINAAHTFVEEVDASVLSALDVRAFCADAVLAAFNDKATGARFSAKYHSLTENARSRFLRNWFQNVHGMSSLPEDVLRQCALLRGRSAG